MARIEAMKALNAEREQRGHAQAYDEAAFADEAHRLELLAIDVINQ
jgi:hypothetical protein